MKPLMERFPTQMSGQKTLLLTATAWQEILQHAQETFPEECCGVILSNGSTDHVQRLRNIQNQLHANNPAENPRDATIAYQFDQTEFVPVIREAEATGYWLKAFYHSHPNHEAYFSEEDKAGATPFGEPTFPETAHIVVSIYDRIVRRICAYGWSEEQKDFVEIPV